MCQSQFEALIYQLHKNIKEKPSKRLQAAAGHWITL